MRILDKDEYKKVRESITMNNLKKIRKSKKYTIVKTAMSVFLTDSTIVGYEVGVKIPSLPSLIKLADLFNCNLDYLIDRTDNPISIKDLDKLKALYEEANYMSNYKLLNKVNKEKADSYIKGLLDSQK
jgi:transcriptional regulator with XRE-family HTH domain